ncbi:MAG: alpha/beta fold hydrolase [Pseudomonadota bacterium]
MKPYVVRLQRTLLYLSLTLLWGCGGGGSSSDPDPGLIGVTPTADALLISDAQPLDNAVAVDPVQQNLFVSHLGFDGLSTSYTGDCTQGVAVRHAVRSLADAQFTELVDHKVLCPELQDNRSYALTVVNEAADGDRFETPLSFSTGVAGSVGVTVTDSVSSPRSAVQAAFADYLAGAFLDDLELPASVDTLVTDALLSLAGGWSNLISPGAIYGVTSEQVRYRSRQPDGNNTTELSGLVVVPDTSGAFTPREQIIVLAHATGSTPGDLEPTNAWFLLANILASYGYLVVAPDNWGRGVSSASPETYLMANRTAANALDMVREVIADGRYAAYTASTDRPRLVLIGYSQGGHTALALWQGVITQAAEELAIDALYAGGGPYNLYATFEGVLQHAQDTCADTEYCRDVNDETTVPFATNRVLPGFITYTDTGLNLADLVNGDTLEQAFVDGFLANTAEYDALKAMLFQSSFTNVTNPLEAWGEGRDSQLIFYHSEFDRLVPQANANELVALLETDFNVDYRADACSSLGYQTLSGLTPGIVGVVHAVCGLSMIDEVVAELR